MSGVTTVDLREPEQARELGGVDERSKFASAVSYRRCESAARRPRVPMTRTAVS